MRGPATGRAANKNQVTVEAIVELPNDEPAVTVRGHVKIVLPSDINVVGDIKVDPSSLGVWDRWKARRDVTHVNHAYFKGHPHPELNCIPLKEIFNLGDRLLPTYRPSCHPGANSSNIRA